MTSPEGHVYEYASMFLVKASNNEANYEATLAGLRLCLAADAKKVHLSTESQLIGKHIKGQYETREPTIIKYLELVR